MTEAWKQWEGQVVNGEFHLRQYLGGGENSAVFLTERSEREHQKAAIKLLPTPSLGAGRETVSSSLDPALPAGSLPAGQHGATLRGDGLCRRESVANSFT